MRRCANTPLSCSGNRRHLSSSSSGGGKTGGRSAPFSIFSSRSSSSSSASLSSLCGAFQKDVSRRFLVQSAFPTVVVPADLPKRLILVRHGESEANVDRSQYAHLPDWRISLTARGKNEAHDCGRRLRRLVKDEPLFIYYSPYQRTRQTLDEIRRSLNPRQIMGEREDERLREQEMGNYQPLPSSGEMDDLWDARNEYGRSFFRFPCGESGLDVMDRVGSFFDALLKEGWSHRWWKKEQLLPVSQASSSHTAPPPNRTPTTPTTSSPTIHTSRRSGRMRSTEVHPVSPTTSNGTPPASLSASRSSSRYVGGPSPSSHVLPVFFHSVAATSVFGNPTATSEVDVATTTTSIPVITRGAGRENDAEVVSSRLSSFAPSSTSVKAEGGEHHGQGTEETKGAAACHTTTTTTGEDDREGGEYTVVSTTTVFAVAPCHSPTLSSVSSASMDAARPSTPSSTAVPADGAPPSSLATTTAASSFSSSVPGVRVAGRQETSGEKGVHRSDETATPTTTDGATLSDAPSLSWNSPSFSSPASLHLRGEFTEHPAPSLSFPASPSSSSPYASLVEKEEDEDDYTDVIVSHGLLIRLFISRWFGIPAEKRELLANPPNCSLIVLERARGTKDFRLTETSKKLFGDALKDVL